MNLTGHQVKQINEFMGGDYEVEVTIRKLEARVVNTEEGPIELPEGLYIWCTEYPEEGAVLLEEQPSDAPG